METRTEVVFLKEARHYAVILYDVDQDSGAVRSAAFAYRDGAPLVRRSRPAARKAALEFELAQLRQTVRALSDRVTDRVLAPIVPPPAQSVPVAVASFA